MTTSMTNPTPRWRVVAFAASRLAAVYGAGVLLLAIPLIAIFGGLLPALTIPVFAVLGFIVGFMVLAIAKRLGFAILWLLLLVLWIASLQDGIYQANGSFLFWTMFAVPLYLITAVGLSARSRGLRLEILLTLGAWAVAAAVALTGEIYIDAGPPIAATWDNYVCAAWPLLVAVRELVRVGFRSRTTIDDVAAA
jgi:hypothetical protein